MNAYPTTPDLSIKAGDRVRSYDFPGRTDCFIEGVVVGIEQFGVYVIAANRAVVEGREVPLAKIGGHIQAPVNGSRGMFGTTTGVVKLPTRAVAF